MADQAYCMKCREKRDMHEPQRVTLKNGSQALQSKCRHCGTTLTKIVARA